MHGLERTTEGILKEKNYSFDLAQAIVDESAMAGGDGYGTAYYRFRYEFIGKVGAHGLAVEPPPRLEGHNVLEGTDQLFQHAVFSGFNEHRGEIVHIRSLSDEYDQDFAVAWLNALTGNITFWPDLDVDTLGNRTILHRGKNTPQIVIENLHEEPSERNFYIAAKSSMQQKYTSLDVLEQTIKATTPTNNRAVAFGGAVAIGGVKPLQVQQ